MKMPKISTIILWILAVVLLIFGLKVTGDGFLDLSNLFRVPALILAALFCVGGICKYFLKDNKNETRGTD